MLILPLVDLLILTGTGFLVVGFLLKAVTILTHTNPAILGFSSIDFLLMTGVCWAFALVLAARSYVKLNEPNLQSLHRNMLAARERRDERALEVDDDEPVPLPPEVLERATGTGGGENR